MHIAVPVVGPSGTLRSLTANATETINWYDETTGSGGKAPKWAAPTPGLTPFAQVFDSPGTGIFSQDARTFGVTGTTFWEVAGAGTITAWGSVTAATSILPSRIVSNGTAGFQLCLCSGGDGYLFDLQLNTLTEINSTNFPGTGFPEGECSQVEFMDGYFLALKANSREWNISALEDGTSWDPLDVAQRSEGSDNIHAMRRTHRQIAFLGTLTSELWYNSGDALFPFAPVPGTFIETGSASTNTARIANTLAWVSRDERGNGIAYLLNGSEPRRISTPAQEKDWQHVEFIAALTIFAQQQEGHEFLWITVDSVPWTWVYDVSEGEWHKRAFSNPISCAWEPHLASAYAFAVFSDAVAQPLVLDRASGVIYSLDLAAYDESIAT